ncbi:MAG: hypothetical protein MUP36_00295, partial [Demequinaceae bacterium]|nr:hypothetical protein [Demequinaceae bacterium]
MRGFDDVLREGFEQHSRALQAAGGIGQERAQAAVGAIRRRRRIRAYTTGAVSVVAIAGLAVAASAVLPLHLDRGQVDPGGYPWCDPATYPLPNPEALTEYFPYEGRVYADYDAMEFVYVSPDGTREVLEPGADGAYPIRSSGGQYFSILMLKDSQESPPESPMFFDLWLPGEGSAAAGHFYTDDPEGLRLAYEWTTVVPEEVPPGLSVEGLVMVNLPSIGLPGASLSASAVPPDAVVQTVVRWAGGREQVTDIAVGEPGAPVTFFLGLESVTTRVSNLPGGEDFEI